MTDISLFAICCLLPDKKQSQPGPVPGQNRKILTPLHSAEYNGIQGISNQLCIATPHPNAGRHRGTYLSSKGIQILRHRPALHPGRFDVETMQRHFHCHTTPRRPPIEGLLDQGESRTGALPTPKGDRILEHGRNTPSPRTPPRKHAAALLLPCRATPTPPGRVH